MRNVLRLSGFCVVLVMASALAGCMSTAFKSDLAPGTAPAPSVGAVRFHVAGGQVTPAGDKPSSGTMLAGTPADLNSDAVSAQPALFSDDWSALPLALNLHYQYKSSKDWVRLLQFPLGFLTIPIPFSDKADYTASLTVPAPDGDLDLGSVAFQRRDVSWFTAYTPLGLIPVPGTSRISRAYTISESRNYVGRAQKFTNAVCVEALTKTLGQCDAAMLARLQALSEDRKSRLHELSVDGKACWGFLGFRYSQSDAQTGPRDVANLLFFTEPPTWNATPVDEVVVARRGADGRWRPCDGYLMMTPNLTAASVLLEDGKPAQVVVRPVEEPPLEDFIDLPDVPEVKRAAYIRWNNGVLLQVKNRSLPRMMSERSSAELLDTVTRIEKTILALDQWAEQYKESAQRMVEQGQGDPAPAREIGVLVRQRIEILKPILIALKQGAVQKQQGT